MNTKPSNRYKHNFEYDRKIIKNRINWLYPSQRFKGTIKRKAKFPVFSDLIPLIIQKVINF